MRTRLEEPLELDDEPVVSVGSGLGLLKWGLWCAGGFLACVSLVISAIPAAPVVGVACFLAISARLVQAEQHR